MIKISNINASIVTYNFISIVIILVAEYNCIRFNITLLVKIKTKNNNEI